jgi:hypothetical protein
LPRDGISANNKTYDATTAATLNTGGAGYTGIIGGDNLTVATASGMRSATRTWPTARP